MRKTTRTHPCSEEEITSIISRTPVPSGLSLRMQQLSPKHMQCCIYFLCYTSLGSCLGDDFRNDPKSQLAGQLPHTSLVQAFPICSDRSLPALHMAPESPIAPQTAYSVIEAVCPGKGRVFSGIPPHRASGHWSLLGIVFLGRG